MKRKFKSYYSEAYFASKKSFKNLGNLVKYYSYFFPTLILRFILIIAYPLFRAEDHRLSRQIRNNENINISKVFSVGDNPNNVWKSIHLNLILFLRFIGKAIAIALPFAVYLYFMTYICNLTKADYYLFVVLLYIPLGIGIALELYTILKFLIQSLVSPFLLEASDSKNASSIYSMSMQLKERGGLGTVILNIVINSLIQILMLGVGIGITLLTKLLSSVLVDEAVWVIYFMTGLICTLLGLRYLPVFTMTRRIINELLFEDLFINSSGNENIKVENKILKSFENKINKNDIKENMLKLFDEQVELSNFIEPKAPEEPKDIETLKNVEETKDFFDDSRIINETNDESKVEVQRNSFQEILVDQSDDNPNQDTLSSIDDLLKEKNINNTKEESLDDTATLNEDINEEIDKQEQDNLNENNKEEEKEEE